MSFTIALLTEMGISHARPMKWTDMPLEDLGDGSPVVYHMDCPIDAAIQLTLMKQILEEKVWSEGSRTRPTVGFKRACRT